MNIFLEKIKKHIPVPKMIRFDHAGIDVCSAHIRHINFKKINNKLILDTYGVEEIKNIRSKEDLLSTNLEILEILEILKKIKKEYKYKYVEVSLPEELAYIYTQEVDDGDISAINSQIEFKIEENVPFKVDEIIFDFVEILNLENKKKLISITVVSKKIIDDYIETFQKANLKIVSILIQNQALSKSLIHKDDKNSYCIVSIERKNISVSIVSFGIVLYTSTINKTIFDQDLNLERIEILEEVIKDIYKIIFFWFSYIEKNNSYKFNNIKSLIINSTHSNIIDSEFINMMTNKLAMPIEKPNVWVNVLDLNEEIPLINKTDSYQYATSIGLALPRLK